jgi:hypothetical protein
MTDIETPRTVAIERVMKIRWDKLPEWAKFIAQDSNGEMWMYATKPSADAETELWATKESRCERLPSGAIADWRFSLQWRPKND